jgi:hypothetical protein
MKNRTPSCSRYSSFSRVTAYTVGFMTFLLVLGLGLSPLPEDSGSIFIARVFDVMVGAVFAIGMASLLRSAFRAR